MIKKIFLWLYLVSPKWAKGILRKKIALLEGGQMYSDTLRAIFRKVYKIDIGYGSYGGCFNLDNKLPANVSFGNYCSVAPNIRIYRTNHPKQTFTSHPLLFNPVAGFTKRHLLRPMPLEIGHDVWIGEWAVILPNVKSIGNGAIIGAGSIVTKDVQAYTIVGGNPAKVIAKRFSDEVIEQLEETKWWALRKEVVVNRVEELNSMAKFDINRAGTDIFVCD